MDLFLVVPNATLATSLTAATAAIPQACVAGANLTYRGGACDLGHVILYHVHRGLCIEFLVHLAVFYMILLIIYIRKSVQRYYFFQNGGHTTPYF